MNPFYKASLNLRRVQDHKDVIDMLAYLEAQMVALEIKESELTSWSLETVFHPSPRPLSRWERFSKRARKLAL